MNKTEIKTQLEEILSHDNIQGNLNKGKELSQAFWNIINEELAQLNNEDSAQDDDSKEEIEEDQAVNDGNSSDEIDNEIKELIAKAQREAERKKVVKELSITKLMFNDELGEFFDIIEENDWGKEEAISSDIYKERIANKAKYVAEVQSHITPIKLS